MAKRDEFLFCRCKVGSKVPATQTVSGKAAIDFNVCKCETVKNSKSTPKKITDLTVQIDKLVGKF